MTLRRVRVWLTAACVALAMLLVVLLALRGVRSTGTAATLPAPLAIGTAIERPHPTPDFQLVDEQGKPFSVRDWHGKWVVLAPNDTACNETCPLTTGALMQLSAQVRAAGLAQQVVVAEVTVDPWKDSPARLRAYRRMTGAPFEMLTGTPAQIRRFWKFFGVYYKRVPEGRPPAIDWYTHRPSTFNVEHSDNVFFLDPNGEERIADEGMADVGGHLEPALRRLLNSTGLHNLSHPTLPWSATQALDDLYWLMGRNIPQQSYPQASAPTPSGARSALAGSPAPLAALHAQAGALLGSGSALVSRIRELRGYPVVVNAWASWCPPCRSEFPLFASASVRYGRQVAFLGADTEDSADEAKAFLAKHPVSYPSYQTTSAALGALAAIEGTPTTIYLNPAGRVVDVHVGEYDTAASLDNDVERYALGR